MVLCTRYALPGTELHMLLPGKAGELVDSGNNTYGGYSTVRHCYADAPQYFFPMRCPLLM